MELQAWFKSHADAILYTIVGLFTKKQLDTFYTNQARMQKQVTYIVCKSTRNSWHNPCWWDFSRIYNFLFQLKSHQLTKYLQSRWYIMQGTWRQAKLSLHCNNHFRMQITNYTGSLSSISNVYDV